MVFPLDLLRSEIRELDSERQSLVYNHHHELIAASDTIAAVSYSSFFHTMFYRALTSFLFIADEGTRRESGRRLGPFESCLLRDLPVICKGGSGETETIFLTRTPYSSCIDIIFIIFSSYTQSCSILCVTR